MNGRRVSNGFGLSPLPFAEIESWQRLRRIELERWELDGLIELDNLYRRVMSGRQDGADKGGAE